MNIRFTYLLLLFVLAFSKDAFSQDKVVRTLFYVGDTLQMDTVSIFKTGFEVRREGLKLDSTAFYLDPVKARFYLPNSINDSLEFTYYRTPVNFQQTFQRKSTDIVISDTVTYYDPFIYSVSSQQPNEDLFGSTKLNKQGSISRGVTVGNAQNLSLQSTLNLQLDGQIAPNLFLKGSISDDNVPFQPEGNTQKLQEFDQVYLQIYNDDFAVIGGDFWLKKPEGYFLHYQKRTQGLSVENNHSLDWVGLKGTAKHKFSGAFSKGKFARNIIQGVEGNQGPYRLTGAENETFIVVLAGTEKVYIDGKLMTRGQEFDYTIDYNTAEVTFTANNLITKDVRIVIEFQYSDLNYARSLVAYNGLFESEKSKTWINFYSEQDAKNQTIQQNLSDANRLVLSQAGDDITNAFANSIDSIGFQDNRVLYKMVDSLGYDSVLVFTANQDSAIYQAYFSEVGMNEGDYVFDRFTANGRVYRWVAPVDGVPQGNYAPVQLLVAPQRKQMFVVGTEYRFKENMRSSIEFALSNQDQNTFSDLDAFDDQGVALKWKWRSEHQINQNWNFNTHANFEYNEAYFQPIQWFRSVEFDRDWNVRNESYFGNQYLTNVALQLADKKGSSFTYNVENFIWGEDYNGLRNNLTAKYRQNGWFLNANGSLLLSDGNEASNFLRHEIDFSRDIWKLKVGFQDIHETNERRLSGENLLQADAYRFYDWKTYVSTQDTSVVQLEVYYRERYDWFPDSTRLIQSTAAQNVGFIAGLVGNPDHNLRLNMNYRRLDVLDSSLFEGKPENTLLTRLEHVMRLWKGSVNATSFYEIGSGLELQKEFLFIEVNPGQGSYTWNDYNNDGIKDLGEFEVAVFSDQGNYIRVFVPTNTYVKTYTNQFTSSIFLRPERLWREKKGFLKGLSRFSNQTVYKINRKTNNEADLQRFNPFVYTIADTSLVSISTSFRNTLYFNKTNSIFGLNYTYQENGSKVLLTNGFDTRLHTFHEGQLRWNISKFYNIRINSTLGRKKSASDYAAGRDYFINYFDVKPIFSYQPNTTFRLALNGKYSEKENMSELSEKAVIRDVGIDLRYNQIKKGSLTGRFNFILIDYNASSNSSIAFEMLEGLKTGNNFTWGLTYQRKIAKNLQLNFNYNGRKSEDSNTIHSGGMELRAFF